MSFVDMSTPPSQSQALLSVPIAPSSKPPSTAPQHLEPQSQAHAETLARHGIKVRDFAYESKLPPIRSWYKRQIQPKPPSLKRLNRDGEDDNSSYWNDSHARQSVAGRSTKKAKLERELTEPDIQNSSSTALVPMRARVYTNLLHEYEPDQISQSSNENSQQSDWPQPPQHSDSQESDPNIDTPLVTPNGSFHLDNSSIPASHLDATASQSPTRQLIAAKLVIHHSKDRTGLLGDLSPMSSLSSLRSDASPSPLSPSKGRRPRAAPRKPKSEIALRSSLLKCSPPLSGSRTPLHASRYYLRKRPAASQIPSPRRTRRTVHTVPRPSSGAPAHTMQPPHPRQAESSSPRSRPQRKRIAG